MENCIKDNVTTDDVLETLDFLENLTGSRPERAAAISASILAAFCQDETMARDVIGQVFQLVHEDI